MTPSEHPAALPPFRPECRASGVLLHVTSLPSAYGIGDLGPAAYAWVDELHDSGQRWWQVLPLGPTGYGNSPYSSLSSFAGNGLLISPELLIEDGLLGAPDCEAGQSLPKNVIDFDAVIAFKGQVLERAWSKFLGAKRAELRTEFEQFCFEQADWLEDYALFRALKVRLRGANLLEWPADLVKRNSSALASARCALAEAIEKNQFEQFLISRQGKRLKDYAHERGVLLIGDLPFFVSPDSSDVWANPEWFLLDENLQPKAVAGVPPDYFSATGQLWGNPVYDWDALRRARYRWWIDRLKALLTHVDVVRLDHFRGFCAAWQVAPTARTAETGHWVSAPGADFFEAVRAEMGHLPFIAEDLGVITPDVVALRDQFQLPGTRVLQFAFDGHSDNPHLPRNYAPNTVAYTGTHDNPTVRDWFESLPENARREAVRHGECAWDFIRLVWSSKAGLAVAPLQDLLGLGAEGRMNVPGTATGNWRWRCAKHMLQRSVFDRLHELTSASGRMAGSEANLQAQEAIP